MFYQGLLYAGSGGLTFNGAGRSVRIEGAIMSQGDTNITADQLELVYDRNILDSLFQVGGTANLEQIFFYMN